MDGLTHRCTKLLEVALKLDIFFILPKGGRERERQTDRQTDRDRDRQRLRGRIGYCERSNELRYTLSRKIQSSC